MRSYEKKTSAEKKELSQENYPRLEWKNKSLPAVYHMGLIANINIHTYIHKYTYKIEL